MKRILIAALAALSFGGAISSPAHASNGTQTGTIKALMYYEGHAGRLVVMSAMSDLAGCGNANYFLLSDTQAHYKETVAMLLTAYSSDSTVDITVDNCFQGYGRIAHVMLKK